MSEPSKLHLNKLRRDVRDSGRDDSLLSREDLIELYALVNAPDVQDMTQAVLDGKYELDALEAVAADVWMHNRECLDDAKARWGLRE